MPEKSNEPKERLTYQKAFDKALALFKASGEYYTASELYNEDKPLSARFENLRIVLMNQEASDETCLEAIHNYLSDKDPEDKSERISGNILCEHEICASTSCRFHRWLYTPGSKDLNFSFEICLIKTLHNYLSEEGWHFWFQKNSYRAARTELLKKQQQWVRNANNGNINISSELADFGGAEVRPETRWSVAKNFNPVSGNKFFYINHRTMGELSTEQLEKLTSPKPVDSGTQKSNYKEILELDENNESSEDLTPSEKAGNLNESLIKARMQLARENLCENLKTSIKNVVDKYTADSVKERWHGGDISIKRCKKLLDIAENESIELTTIIYSLINDLKNNHKHSGMRDDASLGMLLLKELSENLVIKETIKNTKLTENDIKQVKKPRTATFFLKGDAVTKNCLELKKVEKALQSILDEVHPNFHPEKVLYAKFLENQKNPLTYNRNTSNSIISNCSSFDSSNKHRHRF